MIRRPRKIAIYYRDLPAALTALIAADDKMTLRKDGVWPFRELRVPRVTVEIASTVPHEDRERHHKLVQLLEELEGNNQILGFSA